MTQEQVPTTGTITWRWLNEALVSSIRRSTITGVRRDRRLASGKERITFPIRRWLQDWSSKQWALFPPCMRAAYFLETIKNCLLIWVLNRKFHFFLNIFAYNCLKMCVNSKLLSKLTFSRKFLYFIVFCFFPL